MTRWSKSILSSAFLAASLAYAAPDTTTITGNVYTPTGQAATGGTVKARLSQAGTTPNGANWSSVSTSEVTATIGGSGDVAITLTPNDAIRPSGTYYEVRFTVTGPAVTSWIERWYVDTEPDSVDIGAVTRLDVVPGKVYVQNSVRFVGTTPVGGCTAADEPRMATTPEPDVFCECVNGAWDCDSIAAGTVGGTPGGFTTQVQYNDGGEFGGNASLTFNEVSQEVIVGAAAGQGALSLGQPGTGQITMQSASGGRLLWEGTTSDAYETDVRVTDPTADRLISFPDASGSVCLSDNACSGYPSVTQLGTNDGNINQAGDLVSWFQLKDIPTEWADGDDVGDPGSGDGGYTIILEDTSTNVTGSPAVTTLNFIGTGITCALNGAQSRTDCTVPAAPVSNVFGRSGEVSAVYGDYNASLISRSATTALAATDVQAALAEVYSEKAATVHTHAGADVTSSVATATALAANGANCSAGQAAGGVDASGAAEACITPITTSAFDTSAELLAIMTDETGTGALVFGTSPTITTPVVTLEQGTAPANTAEGRIQWETDVDDLVVGTGAGTARFRSAADLETSDSTDPNTGSNYVHWDILTGVPASLLDGDQNDGGGGVPIRFDGTGPVDDAVNGVNFIGGAGVDIAYSGAASPETALFSFDATETGAVTWGSGSSIVHTFNASSGTDVTTTYGDGTLVTDAAVTAASYTTAAATDGTRGVVFVDNTTTCANPSVGSTALCSIDTGPSTIGELHWKTNGAAVRKIIASADTPADTECLKWDAGTSAHIYGACSAAGSSTFIDLTDTDPTNYTGHGAKIVQVNGTAGGNGTGLEFGAVPIPATITAAAQHDILVYDATPELIDVSLPDCDTASTSKLLYSRDTQTFTCGTDQNGGGSGDITDVWGCSTGDCSTITGAAGDTLNGASADALALPAGASKTVDANGEITVDTDGEQLVYYSDAERVLDRRQILSVTVLDPSDADSPMILKAPYGMTITDIDCLVDAGSVVIDVQECTSAGASCATVDTTITCDSDGAADDGSLTNGSIDAGDWIKLDIGTVTTSTQVAVTITYTITRE